MGATQMSTNGWIDKRCGIYMQWNNNQPLKENSVTCYNMDEPWDKWNKPPTKGQIWFHLCKVHRLVKFGDRK